MVGVYRDYLDRIVACMVFPSYQYHLQHQGGQLVEPLGQMLPVQDILVHKEGLV